MLEETIKDIYLHEPFYKTEYNNDKQHEDQVITYFLSNDTTLIPFTIREHDYIVNFINENKNKFNYLQLLIMDDKKLLELFEYNNITDDLLIMQLVLNIRRIANILLPK